MAINSNYRTLGRYLFTVLATCFTIVGLQAAPKVEKFQVAEADVTLKVPENPAAGRPWLWIGEFAGHLGTLEDGLVAKGWHVAYVNQANRFGSPRAMKVWEALYDDLHGTRNLSPRPALLGISRGGLYVTAWTRLHPDRVSVLYLDNGVCDIRSWPGGFQLEHKGKGSANDWKLYKAEFGFTDDATAQEQSVRPDTGFDAAIKAGVTLISCHGTADHVVPYEDNAAKVVAIWEKSGGKVVLFPKPGGDHHPHGLPDPAPLIEALNAATSPKPPMEMTTGKPASTSSPTPTASPSTSSPTANIGDTTLQNLRCEYHTDPLGIDIVQPRLSWKLESGDLKPERGVRQTAYRILCATSRDLLVEGKADLWDSGKVASDEIAHVVYGGKPLTSGEQVFWKVRAWDQNDQPTPWSEPAKWSMGMLKDSDWKAQWIGFDEVGKVTPTREAELADKGHKITIKKALYGVKGDPAKQIDITKKLQAHIDAGHLSVQVTNEFAGQDPAPGEKKVLEAEWLVDDWSTKSSIAENSICDLTIGSPKTYHPAPYFRKEFNVSSKVKRAILYATAQGVFELTLNGQRVGDEVFMPGWTDYRKRIYYRAYDVTDLLKEGPNVLGAILGDGWFRGNISCIGQNQYGNNLRLKSQLQIDYDNGNSETLATDSSWRATTGPILESDMQAGEVYDARREMTGWNSPGFDASAWAPVVTGSNLNPPLQAYPGVPVRPMQELPAVKVTEPKPGTFVFDLGQNFSGWARLKVNGQAGDKITLIFAEMLKEDGTAYTINLRSARAVDTYILKGGGEEVWEPRFTFHGFRYVQVTGLREKPSADTITGIPVYSDSPEASSFECSNPMVNQIYRNIVWGQRSNYLEVPTDCPQRDERLGWTGDTQVFIRTGTYNQNVAAFFTKWIQDLADTQNAQGLFGNQAPVFHGHGAAAWACAGIICPWTIHQVYGDTRLLEKHYDAMARYMEACGKDGLGGRKAHTWGDWLAPGHRPPNELVSSAYFAYTSKLMADMARALGKTEDASKYDKQFEDTRAHFQKSFVEPDGKLKSDLQTAYCMALYYDLLTPEQRKQAEAHLVERIKKDNYHLNSGFLGVPILLPTLTEMGRSDLAYRILQNTTYPSWGYSIDQGATTIWERWNSYSKDKGFGDVKMNSFNHYSLGAVGEWMFRSLLGIETDGPGFKKILMKPELGDGITWAKGHYDSIRGRIGSDWKIEDSAFDWKIEIPANTTATVFVPTKDAASVSESGQPATEAEGVKFLRMENGRAVFEIGSGNYEFRSRL